jgi:hypothetical protein
VMAPASDGHGDDDILRAIQAKIDRENGFVPTSTVGVPTNHSNVGDENDRPDDAWDTAGLPTGSREPPGGMVRGEADLFRERLDHARSTVDAMSHTSVLLDELESLSKQLGDGVDANKLELEQVAKLHGVVLPNDEEKQQDAVPSDVTA